jgi:polar amino acid transport system permease protein
LNPINGKPLFNKQPLKFTLVDMAAVILIIMAISVFMSRMNHILDYHWEWGRIPSYFFFWDKATGELKANILAKGFAATVKLSLWAMGFGFLLGTVSGVMGAKGSWGQRFVSRIYVETIRNIPSLVLLIIFYYFVSSRFLDSLGLDQYLREAPVWIQQVCGFFLTGPDRINAFMSAGIALGLYEGAYISEIVRGGINSISEGQWEAGRSIGLSGKNIFLLIVFPQTFRKVAFPLAGQLISAIKDSSIVSVISIQELTFQGMELMNTTFLTFEIWITVAVLYFILTFPLSRMVAFLERKYALKQ